MGFYVYVLRCGDGSLYTGWTVDIVRRLSRHRAGQGGRYTRSHLPLELVYQEECASRSDAMRREGEIKRMSRGMKLTLIEGKADA